MDDATCQLCGDRVGGGAIVCLDCSQEVKEAGDQMRNAAWKVVDFVNKSMGCDWPCPFCGHHYYHTTEKNAKERYEKNICLIVLLEEAINTWKYRSVNNG